MPYAGLELEYYEECMRAVPAIAKFRASGSKDDMRSILEALHRTSKDCKVDSLRRWSILCTAYMAWVQQLFEANAELSSEPVNDLIERAIGAATEWVADA